MLFSFGLTFEEFLLGGGFFFQFCDVENLANFAHRNQATLIEFQLENIKISQKNSRKLTNFFKDLYIVNTRCYCEF